MSLRILFVVILLFFSISGAAPAHAAIRAQVVPLNEARSEGLLTVTFPVSASADIFLPMTITQVLGDNASQQYERFKEKRGRRADQVRTVLLLSNSAQIEDRMYKVAAGTQATFTIVSILSSSEPLLGAYYIPIRRTHPRTASVTTEYLTLHTDQNTDPALTK